MKADDATAGAAEQPADTPGERMATADHLLWLADRHPEVRSTVVGVSIFAGSPNPDALRDRLVLVANEVVRFRQRVRANPLSIAPPRWEVDPDFNIDNHLRWAPPATQPRSIADLLAMASPKALEPFPSDRPLWEIVAVDGLEDGRFALIQKLHHALADGLSALKIQLELFDFEPDPAPRPAAGGTRDYLMPMGQVERMGDAVRWDLRRRASTFQAASKALGKVRQSPLSSGRKAASVATSLTRIGQMPTAGLSPLLAARSDQRRYATLTLPLSAAKSAGKAAGTKLNAVFLAGIAEGLRTYHQHHEIDLGQVRLGFPISTRETEETGNEFVGARMLLPLKYDDVRSQIRTIDKLASDQMNEPALRLLPAVSEQLTRLPSAAAVRLLRRVLQGTDIQASNVPGSPVPMYLLGNEMLAQYGFGPTTTSAANITLVSYQNDLNVGVAMNTGAIEDTNTFVQHLRDGFNTVMSALD